MPKRLTVAIIAVAALAVGGTAVAQSQRFSDVPPDHGGYAAVEWAASAGLTLGKGDGTFGPDEPLSKRHAVAFMERFYDEVLRAEVNEDFTRAHMMWMIHGMVGRPEPRGGSGSATTTTTTAPPSGDWLPRGDSRTADGRCAHILAGDDVYEWEDCAWGGARNPVMGRSAAEALARRVWDETQARGKPNSPPVFTEGDCGAWRAAACYIPGTHTISIESDATRRTILHELAHALISGDPTMIECMEDWAPSVQACGHGMLFRCAADALYQRYADIDPAGVCGILPDLGAWIRSAGSSVAGEWIEYRIEAPFANGEDGSVALTVRCTNGDHLRVAALGVGNYHFRASLTGGGLLDYRFGDESRPTRITAGSYRKNGGDIWIVDDPRDFLSAMVADTSGRLFLALVSSNFTGDPEGSNTRWGDGTPTVDVEATLSTRGYRTHVRPFVDDC